MDALGPLLASGRAADVYDTGGGLVLRRYRTPHSCLHEAAIMQHVREHRYPVPEVVEVSGGEILMERVEGLTMLDDLSRRPWMFGAHARQLAELLHRLHAVPAAPWMEERLGGGDAVVHLDLHPDNVMLTPDGPVVIDWTNAGRGDPDTEVAYLWVIMATSVVPGGRLQRTVLGAGRRVFLRALLRRFDRDVLRTRVALAAEVRARDRNVLDEERERIHRFNARWAV